MGNFKRDFTILSDDSNSMARMYCTDFCPGCLKMCSVYPDTPEPDLGTKERTSFTLYLIWSLITRVYFKKTHRFSEVMSCIDCIPIHQITIKAVIAILHWIVSIHIKSKQSKNKKSLFYIFALDGDLGNSLSEF